MMFGLIRKEINDFWSNGFGLFSIGILILLAFLFLWIFPDTSYPSYGLAEADLYFEFMSYLLLFVVPAYSVGLLANEYKHGTTELIRSLSIPWSKIVLAKFCTAILILGLILVLTVPHLMVVDIVASRESMHFSQRIGSYVGLIGAGACYAAISILITSYIEGVIASFITSVFVCFLIHSGLSILAELPIFSGGPDFWLDHFSLNFHTDHLARGVLRLSSIVYFTLLISCSIWAAALHLKYKEV